MILFILSLVMAILAQVTPVNPRDLSTQDLLARINTESADIEAALELARRGDSRGSNALRRAFRNAPDRMTKQRIAVSWGRVVRLEKPIL
jgi:hypothetical protein